MKTITHALVRKLFPKRKPWCYKGNFGKLLVIGGSRMYSGSPALAALAAVRAGTDLVTVAAPKRAADIIAGFGPDIITSPLKGDYINAWHLNGLLKLSEKSNTAVIGGGMERNRQTIDCVARFLKAAKVPCVVDADAVYAAAKKPDVLKKGFVLTPHSYEFWALSGRKPSHDIRERAKQVAALSRKLGCTVLLKGHVDAVSDGKRIAVSRTGSPFMTKGGTGDTLAGLAGALLARGADPFDAACAAAWINGKAGELAAKEYGEGLMAMDLVGKIHKAL
jgi:NAD(P)H-hydrate epimerase